MMIIKANKWKENTLTHRIGKHPEDKNCFLNTKSHYWTAWLWKASIKLGITYPGWRISTYFQGPGLPGNYIIPRKVHQSPLLPLDTTNCQKSGCQIPLHLDFYGYWFERLLYVSSAVRNLISLTFHQWRSLPQPLHTFTQDFHLSR